MKILIISHYYYPENFKINDLAEELKNRGNDVAVMTGIPNYPDGKYYKGYGVFKKRKEIINGIPVDRIPIAPRGNNKISLFINFLSFVFLGSFYALKYLSKNIDLIFVFEPSPITVGIPAIILKKMKKVPIYFWVLDLWPESIMATTSIKSKIIINQIDKLVTFIYKRCDKLLISSNSFKENLLSHHVSDEKIYYLPNWAEELYEKGKSNHSEVNLPDGFTILFAGNIGFAQDFATLIEVAKSLSNYKDIHFVILGDGRNSDWVKAEVESNNLDSNFHLLGKKNQETARDYMSATDVLFLSLKNEPIFALTVPAKLQVYMTQSKPIIAALEGEGAKIVEEAECGISCKSGNVEEIKEAVLKLYSSEKEYLIGLGQNARTYYDKNFKREKIITGLNNLFERDLKI